MGFKSSAIINRLTVCRQNYLTQEEFENAIKEIVVWLMKEEYVMTIKYDEPALGIVLIEYDYLNEEYGGALPRWLTPEDEELLISAREELENEKV